MSVKCFVDTNILVYAHDTSAGTKHNVASALIERHWQDANASISVQVLQEFYVSLRRKVTALAPSAARELVALYGRWRTFQPEASDVLAAIDLHQENQLSFWDAMIVIGAARLGCDLIYSEDMNSGQAILGVKIVNPFAQSS
ncbi:MAG: PIN domain-containing protein [Trueperaceae bacterium]|jgi:predicted nucleic acid-binding protein